MLDRTIGVGDPLAVTSASARVAAPILAMSGAVGQSGLCLPRSTHPMVERQHSGVPKPCGLHSVVSSDSRIELVPVSVDVAVQPRARAGPNPRPTSHHSNFVMHQFKP